MSRKESEKRVIRKMIALYCKHKEGNAELCKECRELVAYAEERIERCPLGDKKSTCRKCTIHCYERQMAARVKRVMRYSGPRMLLYAPIDAIIHIWREL